MAGFFFIKYIIKFFFTLLVQRNLSGFTGRKIVMFGNENSNIWIFLGKYFHLPAFRFIFFTLDIFVHSLVAFMIFVHKSIKFLLQKYFEGSIVTFMLKYIWIFILLNIMYNIYDFLHFPARNKMYEGAARVHFIFAGKCKKSEMLYITSTALGVKVQFWSSTFYSLSIHFTFWVIPCEKSKKTWPIFFWFLTLKVKSIRYFSDKNNFFDKFGGFLTIFRFFRKSQLFWKLQKWEFANNVLLFFYCSKVS